LIFIHFEYLLINIDKSLFYLLILRITLTKDSLNKNLVAYQFSLPRSHQHTYPQI